MFTASNSEDLTGLTNDRHWPARMITMTRPYIGVIAVGLLITISGPSFAAKRIIQTSDSKRTERSQPRTIRSSGSAVHPNSNDPYSDSRNPDPYAFGVNWPKGA